MTNAAKPSAPAIKPTSNLFNIKEKILSSHTEELVIALCGPIGSPLSKVAKAFELCLIRDFDYESCNIIRLSSLIEQHKGSSNQNSYERIKHLIKAGDELRKEYGSSILAELAVSEISIARSKQKDSAQEDRFLPRRVCHIINSIKNQEELELLKLVYRDMLYVVGVFAPLPARVRALEQDGMSIGNIYDIIDQDSGEELEYGQTVRDTFPNSDFFLRVDQDTDSQIENRVERFLSIILGTKIITPTPHETAMYFAASAAGNSACLSRQVGASILDKDRNIISVGWNDVPRSGGGLYRCDDTTSDEDHRCWNLRGGICFNDNEKDNIVQTIVNELKNANIISTNNESLAKNIIMKNEKVKNLIEFSRSVHAEMHAIINAGSAGNGTTVGSNMFVTTYPCHSCARHIVAAGITEVYFIEPYRKSLAKKLHGDAITEEETDLAKVRILPYDGVAPTRYLKLFRIPPNSRKAGGVMALSEPNKSKPRFDKTLEALPALEGIVVKGLIAKNIVGGKDNG